MIKSFVIGAAGALAIGSSAFAADLRPASAALAPVFTWSGFYAGVNVGYVNGNPGSTVGTPLFASTTLSGAALYNQINAVAATGRSQDLSAIMGGGGIGYNMQFGSIVVGLETDIQRSSVSRDTRNVFITNTTFPASPVSGTTTSSQRLDYLGTVRARLGYTVFDNLLVYATGGLAYGEKEFRTRYNFDASGGGSFIIPGYGTTVGRSKMETGYVIGGGLEYALDANWSVKGEALYYDLGKTRASGTFNSTSSFPPPSTFTTTGVNSRIDNKGWIGRIGLNYKFNWF